MESLDWFSRLAGQRVASQVAGLGIARCSSQSSFQAAQMPLWRTENRPQRARLLRRQVFSWPTSLREVYFTPLHGSCSWGKSCFLLIGVITLKKVQSICHAPGSLHASHGRASAYGESPTMESRALSG